ncbi:MAG: hypothetical protein ABI548_16885 [Polyangiaceae bacterium]
MARVPLDLELGIVAESTPGDARPAQVVPTHGPSRGGRVVQFVAFDASPLQPTPKAARHVALGRHRYQHAPGLPPLALEHFQQRPQGGLDRHVPRLAAFGWNDFFGAPVPSLRHADHSVFEVDVPALKNPEFSVAQIRVDPDRDDALPQQRHLGVRDQVQELGRVKELLPNIVALVGPLHAVRGVVLTTTDLVLLRLRRVVCQLRCGRPNVQRRLPREFAALYFRVKRRDDFAEMLALPSFG